VAIIHNTTLQPSKLELLSAWLPGRPWFVGDTPSLQRAGGFRLDDPSGEVGIEFIITRDQATGRAYLVPMTYRAVADDELADALIGTMEHGVLGTRYTYDGARDPVAVAQLIALINGEAVAQAQTQSDTVDPSIRRTAGGRELAAAPDAPISVVEGADRTDINVGASTVRLHRHLDDADPATDEPGSITGPWRTVSGKSTRGRLVSLH